MTVGYVTFQVDQLVLPLTGFNTEFEVEDVTNRAQMALQESGLGAANIYPVVSETFAELAMNAVQHAESPIGAFGFVQFYQSEIRSPVRLRRRGWRNRHQTVARAQSRSETSRSIRLGGY